MRIPRIATAGRWWGGDRPGPGPRLAPRVEPLEGRALLSYLVIPRGHRVVPIHTGDARFQEPLHSNGLAVKSEPRFYGQYTGPQLPALNGVRAQAYGSGTNLVLSGTVAGPIVAKPTTLAQGAIYSFGIDRGGAPKRGAFPGRDLIRIDAVVSVVTGPKGPAATVSPNNQPANTPGTSPKALPSSAVAIQGDTVTVIVPLSLLPSTGHAVNQWNVNFFTRNPNQKQNFHSIASFTPEATQFQVAAQDPTTP